MVSGTKLSSLTGFLPAGLAGWLPAGLAGWLPRGALAMAWACGGIVMVSAVPALASNTPKSPMPETTEQFIDKGKEIYFRRCSFCHGLQGDGEGPAAKYLDPRPRDFTLGTFKFRTTQSGELPLDTDLFRTISRGLPGTGMQAFDDEIIKNGLSEQQRWAVIAYIETLAPEFSDPELDPIKTGKVVKLPANRPAFGPEIVAKGEKVFLKAKCWECHGKQGRGDGQKMFDRKDDWGFPIRIRNVTHPWKIKGGTRVEDIYMRFSTGISGTPMPSFVKALSAEKRWQLANFIKSLQHKLTSHQVLKALRSQADLPLDPKDGAWAKAEPMDIRLAGQVVAAPRWQNPSIELITVQAMFNDKEIALRLVWDDPFKDTRHDKSKEMDTREITKKGAFNSYVEANGMIPRKLNTFRDSIALLFPVKPITGVKKPHFHRGSALDPVHVWRWMSDRNAAGKRAVEESVARGWKQPLKPQALDAQQVVSKAVWEKGQWLVVMKRPLVTGDPLVTGGKGDAQFRTGRFIPMAVNAWDGSNGEHGLIMSLSTWYFVFLEEGTPFTVYLYTALAFLGMGVFGVWLARNAEYEAETDEKMQERPI